MNLCSEYNQDNLKDLNLSLSKIAYSILPCPDAPSVQLPRTTYSTRETMFISPLNSHYERYHWIDVISFQLSNKDSKVNCLHMKNKSSTDPSSIIIFALDEQRNLGTSLSFLFDLSSYLKMSIVTCEYTDQNNCEHVRHNINDLYCYITKLQSIRHIVLFGFSIGVYALVALIESKDLNKVSSIILLSPNWTFSPEWMRSKRKVASQLKKSQIIALSSTCKPIMLIHGKKDTYIKYMLSYQICHQIATLTEWYPEAGEHWEIHIVNRSKFYKKLSKFLKSKQYINKTYALNTPNSVKEMFTPYLFIKDENQSFKQADNEDFNENTITIAGTKGIHIGRNSNEALSNNDMEYYQTFKDNDIIPTNASYKLNEVKSEMIISSFKKVSHDDSIDQGFSFTDKAIQAKANFHIGN